jgi:quinol monooxygenase YgiN
VLNRAVVTDRAEFLRRYNERFRTVEEAEPGTELYVVGIAKEGSALPDEDNAVYFFEVFTDDRAGRFHRENPEGLAAKSLWWDDLLVSRSPIALDIVWAKGMTTVGDAAWLAPFDSRYGKDRDGEA